MVAGSGAELNRAVELVNTFDIDVMKGRSFALFTPAHVDATVIIEELEQIFNGAAAPSGSSGGGTGGGAKKDKEGGGGASAASKGEDSFYRFIEIDRLNAILAITHRPQYLHDIETWVLRLDKTNTEGKGGVNVYRVQHHGALELAHTLSSIFGNGSSQQGSASIAAGRSSMSASNSSSGMGGSSSGMSGGSSSFGGGMSSSMGGSTGSSFGGNTSSSGGMSSGFGGGNTGFGGTNTANSSTMNRSGGMGGGQALMPNVKIIADESNNALIIVANTQEYTIISKVLKQLDVLPLQVLIEATIVEVTLNDDLKYGIEWFLKNGHGNNSVSGGGLGSLLSSAAAGASTSGFSYVYNGLGAAGSMNAVIQAAATKGNVNVISSPSLMVLNNQEATILVGQSVPILSGTSTSLVSTGVTSNTVQMVDTGVNLAIKPRVNANGLVLMDLMQSVNAAVATSSSTIDSPTIEKRQIQTNVAVQSGETIILGGLIQETNTYTRNGVPWLHELPLLGPLFGSTIRDQDKTELVVLLTPRVMKSRQDAQDITEEFKRKLTGIYDEKINIQVEELR